MSTTFLRRAFTVAFLTLGAAQCGRSTEATNTPGPGGGGDNNAGSFDAGRMDGAPAGDGGTSAVVDAGTAYGPDGEVLGAVLPDGAVILADGAVIGSVLPDGRVAGIDGGIIGSTTPGGFALDGGTAYGPDGAVIGSILPDGAVVLPDGAHVGSVLPDGAVVGPDGAVIGNTTPGGSGGTAYLPDGGVLGTVLPDGAVIVGDGAWVGTLLPDGAVLGADGAVIGSTDPNGGSRDAGLMGFDVVEPDAGPADGGRALDSGSTVPGEVCANGFDDNANGMVDEGCPCRAGTRQYCYPGAPTQAGVAGCNWGSQTCVTDPGARVGEWGACAGYGSPGTETCDGEDNDCDRDVDEVCPCQGSGARSCYPGPRGTAGVGACRAGMQTCGRDGMDLWGTCSGYVIPLIERCDGIDNDCDGEVDENCPCRIGATRSCYSGPTGTSGEGPCHNGVQTCEENPDGSSEWGACAGEVAPRSEVCDGIDNDCNGAVDEPCACRPGDAYLCYAGTRGTVNVGACRPGVVTCGAGGRFGRCEGMVLPTREVCDGIDNDCNGLADEWCRCPAGQTVTFRRRHLGQSASRSSMISPGDGLATMPQSCEVAPCGPDQVYVEVSLGSFRCVDPPPQCPANRYPYWSLSGTWRCERGCEIYITYGYLYDNEIRCAPRPDVECGPGQTPHYAFELEAWTCRTTCDNGQYDIFRLGSAQICIPC